MTPIKATAGDGLSQYQQAALKSRSWRVDVENSVPTTRADVIRPDNGLHRVGNRDSQHRRGGDDAPLGGRHGCGA